MVESETERRNAKRYKLDWPVCLWHESTQRFYAGRSADISTSGALIHLPLTVPIRHKEKVDINFPSPDGTNDAERHPAKVFTATVVRINRGQSILEGNQSVAVRFSPDA